MGLSKAKKAARDRWARRRSAAASGTGSTKYKPVIVSDDKEDRALQTRDPKPFPFLQLPREIRRMVYHHLLVASKPAAVDRRMNLDVEDWLRPLSLDNDSKVQPQEKSRHFVVEILSACHQTYQEARPIFYSENTFGFSICSNTLIGEDGYDDYRYDVSIDLEDTDLYRNRSRLPGTNILPMVPTKDICRWEILVEVANRVEFAGAIRRISRYLATRTNTKSLVIRMSPYGAPGDCEVLRYLGSLRNIPKVEFDKTISSFDGIPLIDPPLAENLKGIMEGSSPVDDLPGMYAALEIFVIPYTMLDTAVMDSWLAPGRINNERPFIARASIRAEYCVSDDMYSRRLTDLLKEAETAMEDFDVKKFLAVREVLTQMTIARMADTALNIYSKDRNQPPNSTVAELGAALVARGG